MKNQTNTTASVTSSCRLMTFIMMTSVGIITTDADIIYPQLLTIITNNMTFNEGSATSGKNSLKQSQKTQ